MTEEQRVWQCPQCGAKNIYYMEYWECKGCKKSCKDSEKLFLHGKDRIQVTFDDRSLVGVPLTIERLCEDGYTKEEAKKYMMKILSRLIEIDDITFSMVTEMGFSKNESEEILTDYCQKMGYDEATKEKLMSS